MRGKARHMALPKAVSCDAQLSCSAGLDGVIAPPVSLLCPTGWGTWSPRDPHGIACAQRDGGPRGLPVGTKQWRCCSLLVLGPPHNTGLVEPTLGAHTHRRAHPEADLALGDSVPPPTPNPSPFGVPQVTHGCPTKPTGSSQPGPLLTYPGCLKIPPPRSPTYAAVPWPGPAVPPAARWPLETACSLRSGSGRGEGNRCGGIRRDPLYIAPPRGTAPGRTCGWARVCTCGHVCAHMATVTRLPYLRSEPVGSGCVRPPRRARHSHCPPLTAQQCLIRAPGAAGSWVIGATLEPPLGWDTYETPILHPHRDPPLHRGTADPQLAPAHVSTGGCGWQDAHRGP